MSKFLNIYLNAINLFGFFFLKKNEFAAIVFFSRIRSNNVHSKNHSTDFRILTWNDICQITF